MYSNGIQSYRKTDVITSDPVRLVIMCYEGAVDRLKLAKQKIIEGDYSVGDYVFVSAQIIVMKIPEDEAIQSLKAWEVATKNVA